jgi:hypothetical protein
VLSFSRFRVTPEGTEREDRTIVEQDVFDFNTNEYPIEPLKVQFVALLITASFRLGVGVSSGAATRLPTTPALARSAVKIVTDGSSMVGNRGRIKSI